MTPEELYQTLKGFQEKKGYHFSDDHDHVIALMEALLTNKERYGYMACPCRLANNDRDWDKDIICPCAYREEDVAQYGSCYCNLYVSKEWLDGTIDRQYVPERRPPERAFKP